MVLTTCLSHKWWQWLNFNVIYFHGRSWYPTADTSFGPDLGWWVKLLCFVWTCLTTNATPSIDAADMTSIKDLVYNEVPITKISYLSSWYPYIGRVLFLLTCWSTCSLGERSINPQADMHQLFLDHDWQDRAIWEWFNTTAVVIIMLGFMTLGVWHKRDSGKVGSRNFWLSLTSELKVRCETPLCFTMWGTLPNEIFAIHSTTTSTTTTIITNTSTVLQLLQTVKLFYKCIIQNILCIEKAPTNLPRALP